jgi:hypothetical protein
MITMNVNAGRLSSGVLELPLRTRSLQTLTAGTIIAAIISFTLISPASAVAGETSVTGPSWTTNDALADSAAATAAASVPAATAWGSELIKDFHISGYFQTNQGVFIKPPGWSHSLNNIESLRQLLQVDVNDSIGEHLQFFLRSWFVYEPEYPFESQAARGPENLDDFYNEYGPREYWLKLKFGPLTTFIGRQIAVWGEALSFRIGDVVNPQDVSYAFGFNNLEASRMPIYMLHPILNLPAVGPLSSNFLEVIYAPGFDLLWNHVDYPDDRFEGQNQVAGRVSILPSAGSRAAGGAEFRCRFPESLCIPSPASPFNLPRNTVVVGPPISYVLEGGQIPDTQWAVPRATFANSQVGVRLHSLIGNTEVAAFYWRSFNYAPGLKLGSPGPAGTTRRVTLDFPNYQGVGVTGNHALYELPMWIVNYLPFVLRAESFFKNHDSFSTADPSVLSGRVNSDTFNYMLALDVDSAPAPWLTDTGNLSTHFEFINTITFDSNHNMLEAPGVLTRLHHNQYNLFNDVSTSWWWNSIAPDWGWIYNPEGNTFLLIPSLTLTPPWTNKYFVKIGTTYIIGSSPYAFSAGGSLKGLSSVFAQWQYNFNLL